MGEAVAGERSKLLSPELGCVGPKEIYLYGARKSTCVEPGSLPVFCHGFLLSFLDFMESRYGWMLTARKETSKSILIPSMF